jgi:hypothetical protein
VPTGAQWLYEPKFDGFRGLLRQSSDGLVRLTSRQGMDLTDCFPELAQAGTCLPRSTVRDRRSPTTSRSGNDGAFDGTQAEPPRSSYDPPQGLDKRDLVGRIRTCHPSWKRTCIPSTPATKSPLLQILGRFRTSRKPSCCGPTAWSVAAGDISDEDLSALPLGGQLNGELPSCSIRSTCSISSRAGSRRWKRWSCSAGTGTLAN